MYGSEAKMAMGTTVKLTREEAIGIVNTLRSRLVKGVGRWRIEKSSYDGKPNGLTHESDYGAIRVRQASRNGAFTVQTENPKYEIADEGHPSQLAGPGKKYDSISDLVEMAYNDEMTWKNMFKKSVNGAMTALIDDVQATFESAEVQLKNNIMMKRFPESVEDILLKDE